MKRSQLFIKTTKEAPADEAAKNAQLLIRAGYVYKVMAGVYAYTPLGLRVLEKIKQIVREEMNAIGGQELIMTSLQKKETWQQTDRWDDEIVDVWFKTKLHNGTELGLAWSHEEIIIEMLKNHISSYKDVPVYVYQFQTKLRNELRAKSGILRGREFVMKDMYSCSLDAEQHEAFYQASIKAYMKVYDRVGLGDSTYVTFASGGAFTQFSHEFQTICDAGEDIIFKVPSTGQFFNEEITPAQAPVVDHSDEPKPMTEVEGKNIIGVEDLAKFLNIKVENTTKTMLYETETGQIVAAAVRGGYKINEDKLKTILGAKKIQLADEATVRRVTGAEVGYAGIINLPEEVKIIVDESCANRVNFEMGSNHTHYHSINVNWGRDLPEPEKFYDIKVAREGDMHPETGEVYEVYQAAEVGNIFNFGTHKSEQMDFGFTNEKGEKQSVYLGSYGIGITRLMGVVVEKFADERGIVWPEALAPYRLVITRLGESENVVKAADKLYEQLRAAGVEVLYDDRDARPGEKFADAELMGIPYRVVVSERGLESGEFEVVERKNSEKTSLTEGALFSMLSNR